MTKVVWRPNPNDPNISFNRECRKCGAFVSICIAPASMINEIKRTSLCKDCERIKAWIPEIIEELKKIL